MSTGSRKHILTRRNTTTNEVGSVTLENGELNFEQIVHEGIYKYNGQHMAGIATQQEAGLTVDRFPIRIVVVEGANYAQSHNVDAVLKYWKLVDSTGKAIRFERKVPVNVTVVENYYKAAADLDDTIWAAFQALGDSGHESPDTPEISQNRSTAYVNAQVINPTADILSTIASSISAVVNLCVAAHKYPKLQVAENMYLVGRPHGTKHSSISGISPDELATMEVAGMLLVNSKMLKRQYADVEEGTLTFAANCIATMFRYGLMEAADNREYITVVCNVADAGNRSIIVRDIQGPNNMNTLPDLKVNDVLETGKVSFSKRMVELSMGAVVMAGLNHYSYNHTTTGSIVGGALLTLMATVGMVRRDQTDDMQEQITKVIYQALHPVNKRAIANIFFANAKVWTHGKLAGGRMYNQFKTDTFISIRSRPYPAGCHKAYLAAAVLKKVLDSNLAVFLPWAPVMNEMINHCKNVLEAGARSHMGSMYYTGEPAKQQSSELDNYIPELAAYVQILHKLDSIAMSPNLSPEIAARADINWTNLLKSVKAADLSATPVETVKDYLSIAGVATINLNPEDKSTYATAMQQTNDAKRIIDVFL